MTDTAADTRWPHWAAGMRDLNLGSVLAVRLWTSQSTLGALNLYACSPRWFDPDALAVAEVVGRHASIALSSARQEESLWQAIDARTLIGQAQGILMERFALDDEARVRGTTPLLPEHQHQAQRSSAHPRPLANPARLPTVSIPLKLRTPDAGLDLLAAMD